MMVKSRAATPREHPPQGRGGQGLGDRVRTLGLDLADRQARQMLRKCVLPAAGPRFKSPQGARLRERCCGRRVTALRGRGGREEEERSRREGDKRSQGRRRAKVGREVDWENERDVRRKKKELKKRTAVNAP
jgi:hypothetical protein